MVSYGMYVCIFLCMYVCVRMYVFMYAYMHVNFILPPVKLNVNNKNLDVKSKKKYTLL